MVEHRVIAPFGKGSSAERLRRGPFHKGRALIEAAVPRRTGDPRGAATMLYPPSPHRSQQAEQQRRANDAHPRLAKVINRKQNTERFVLFSN